jgi:hypothetical protein
MVEIAFSIAIFTFGRRLGYLPGDLLSLRLNHRPM